MSGLKNKAGRPSKYHKLVTDLELVTSLCMLGLTNDELADFFNVSRSTLQLWCTNHAEFSDAIKRGRLESLGQVVAALHKKARGFTKITKKVFQTDSGPKEIEVEQYYPPDTGAAALLLKNRDRTRWKDKWPEDVNDSDGYDIEINIVKRGQAEGQD